MPSPTNKAQDNSIRENVYRVIRENITSRQLAPGTTVSTPELAAKLIAPRRHQGEIEGLLRTADAPEAGSPATLEQIMVHLEREVEA